MKLYLILSVVVGGFAGLGFVAGSLASGSGHVTGKIPAQDADKTAADDAAPVMDLPETAILNAAEARNKASTRTQPRQASPNARQASSGPHLVKMANVTFPVRKAASVSFVVADVAVSVSDAQSAAHYEIPQNAARLQAAIEQAMANAADTPMLRGVSIDSNQLSGKLTSDLQVDFADIEDVLFMTLYKHDIGYN